MALAHIFGAHSARVSSSSAADVRHSRGSAAERPSARSPTTTRGRCGLNRRGAHSAACVRPSSAVCTRATPPPPPRPSLAPPPSWPPKSPPPPPKPPPPLAKPPPMPLCVSASSTSRHAGRALPSSAATALCALRSALDTAIASSSTHVRSSAVRVLRAALRTRSWAQHSPPAHIACTAAPLDGPASGGAAQTAFAAAKG
eukprot:4485632-Prymnesium_polylepis.1